MDMNLKIKSDNINAMKVFSAILVVFVHSANILSFNNCTEGWTYTLISALDLLSRICVPIFFLLSGYLMFRKPIVWKANMKKKVRSLLVPYLFWTFFWIAFEGLGYLVASKYFENIFSYSLFDWGAQIIWNDLPFYNPFWYVRNLFVVNLFAPFLRKFIFKFPKLTLVISLVVWFLPLPHTIRKTITFILLGGLLVVYLESDRKYKSFIHNAGLKKAAVIFVFPLSAVLALLFSDIEAVRNIVLLLLTTDVFYCFTKWNMSNGAKNIVSKLLPHTFFIYAFHGKTLSILQKLAIQIIPQISFVIVAEYFLCPAAIIVICIVVSKIYKRLLPRVYKISTGGR